MSDRALGDPGSGIEAGLAEALRPLVAEELERRLAGIAAPEWLTLEEAALRYRTSADATALRKNGGVPECSSLGAWAWPPVDA